MTGPVLAAIDLSHPDHAATIIKKAASLAALEGRMLAVMTVIADFSMSIIGDFFEKGAEAKAMARANEMLHKLVSNTLGEDPGVKHVIAHGTAYEEILKMAEQLGAGLIVIGAHKPRLPDFLLGPNSARVVRHARCSVHVLRDA